MAPAKYADLGKAAKDLFEKNYEHGKYSLEVKSKSDQFEFTTKGAQTKSANGEHAISASHETKMKLCKIGTLKETFKPGSSVLAMDLENGSLLKDTKLNLLFNMDVSGNPIPDLKELKVNYTNDKLNLNLSNNFGNAIKADVVACLPAIAGIKLPNFGFKGGFDLGTMGLTNKEFAFHHSEGAFDCVMKTTLANDMVCCMHNKINADLSLATSIDHSKSVSKLAIAAAMKGSCGSSNQVKIADNGRFAVSHISPLQCGAKLTVSGEFDAFNLGAGGHKLGAGLKFDF